MGCKPDYTTVNIKKETKQRFYHLRLVGESIDGLFERIVKIAELIKTKSMPNEEDVFETAKRLISAEDFRQKAGELLRPLQQPNETLIDTLNRLIKSKEQAPQAPQTVKPLTTTRTVI